MKQLLLFGLLLVCGVSLYAMERDDVVSRETVRKVLPEFKSEIEGFQEEALSHLLSKQMREKMDVSDVQKFKDGYHPHLYENALSCYNAICKDGLSIPCKNVDLMQRIDIFRNSMKCVVLFTELYDLIKKSSFYSLLPEDLDQSSEEYNKKHLIWKAASDFSSKKNYFTQNDNDTISRSREEIQKHINALNQVLDCELIKQAKKELKTLGDQFYTLVRSCNENDKYSNEECKKYKALNNNALLCCESVQATLEEINFYIDRLRQGTEEINQKRTLNQNENVKLPNLFSLKKRILIGGVSIGTFMGFVGGCTKYHRYAKRAHKNGKQTVLDRWFEKGKSVLKCNEHTI